MQSAMLFKALEAIGEPMQKMVFVCVEKTAPYCVGVYVLSDEFLEHSINQFEHLMIQFKECLDNDEWPGYPVQVLELPRYAKMELEE